MGDNNTKWEAVEASDLKAGDKVRVTHPHSGSVLAATVTAAETENVTLSLGERGHSGHWDRVVFVADGWSFERAVPERTPPTPGLYTRGRGLDRGEYAFYHVFSDGVVYSDDNIEHLWRCTTGPLPDDLVCLVPLTHVEEADKRIQAAREYVEHWAGAAIDTATAATILALLDGEARS